MSPLELPQVQTQNTLEEDSEIDEEMLLASDEDSDSDSSSSHSIGQEILEIKLGIQERKRKRNRRGRRGGRNRNKKGATPTVGASNIVGGHSRSYRAPVVSNNSNSFLFQLEQESARWWRRSLILDYIATPAWREAGFINQQQGFFL